MGRATSKDNEVKVETPFRYAHDEIRTQVVVICDVGHESAGNQVNTLCDIMKDVVHTSVEQKTI